MATLRLLAIADRAPTRRIRNIITETPIDAIVTLGDLELSQINDLELITNIPKLGVYGNHCSGMFRIRLRVIRRMSEVVGTRGRNRRVIPACSRDLSFFCVLQLLHAVMQFSNPVRLTVLRFHGRYAVLYCVLPVARGTI